MSPLPARPYSFKARGLYDALLGEGAPDGACSILQNLIHDVTTTYIWTGRPGAVALTNFPNLASPGNISALMAIGDNVFGMLATATNPGYDEPFAYNAASGIFSPYTGVSSSNVPATQASSGPWTPPTMAAVGTKVVVAHPGFSGNNFVGFINIGTITAPVWSAGNTTINALPSVPLAVAQFDNRAWYACVNKVFYSDSLAPEIMTNSTQFLTAGSASTSVLGFATIPIQQTQGGVLAALLVFKEEGFWQITPDATLTYKINGPFKPGTKSPRGIIQTPWGVLYPTDSGVYVVGLDGTVSPSPMPAVRSPFVLCQEPSRIAAGYNNSIYRVGLTTTTNVLSGTVGATEYWYDAQINEWGGPHTPYSGSVFTPWRGTFLTATTLSPGVLYQSDVRATASSAVTELGRPMQIWEQTIMLAQDDVMATKTLIESQIDISFGSASNTLNVNMLTAAQGTAGTTVVSAIVGTYWNQFNWNQANWSSSQYGLRTYNIDWSGPVTYKTAAFAIYGTLTPNLRIGPARFRTQVDMQQNTQNPP